MLTKKENTDWHAIITHWYRNFIQNVICWYVVSHTRKIYKRVDVDLITKKVNTLTRKQKDGLNANTTVWVHNMRLKLNWRVFLSLHSTPNLQLVVRTLEGVTADSVLVFCERDTSSVFLFAGLVPAISGNVFVYQPTGNLLMTLIKKNRHRSYLNSLKKWWIVLIETKQLLKYKRSSLQRVNFWMNLQGNADFITDLLHDNWRIDILSALGMNEIDERIWKYYMKEG